MRHRTFRGRPQRGRSRLQCRGVSIAVVDVKVRGSVSVAGCALVALALALLGGCRAPAGTLQPVAPAPAADARGSAATAPARTGPVRAYITEAWKTLTRSNRQLPEAAHDPKFAL